MSNGFFDDVAKLTLEEFTVLLNSGAFTGFTEQDMAEASDIDREKMRLTNEGLRLRAKAKELTRRRERLERMRGQ